MYIQMHSVGAGVLVVGGFGLLISGDTMGVWSLLYSGILIWRAVKLVEEKIK